MTQASPFPVTAPDLVCIDDCDPLGQETTSEIQNLWQDSYHSLVTPPGGNLAAPDRGVGLYLYLSGTADRFATLPGAIEADFRKDSRIVDCSASVIPQPDGSWLLQIEVQPLAGGVIPLTFAYDNTSGLTPVGGPA